MKHSRLKKKPMEEAHIEPCAWQGCGEHGSYPAPKSRENLKEYQYFCLDHVRQYNKSWNYFMGMSHYEADSYKYNAILGHRPTWKMGIHDPRRNAHIIDSIFAELDELLGTERGAASAHTTPAIPRTERDALAVMGLPYPVTLEDIKKRYKELVKKYHPDVNKNDPDTEERFKQIAEAYRYLKDCGYFS